MAYVTRPALLPADFGQTLEKAEPKTKKAKTATKVPKKKKVIKKTAVVKVPKKGRALPWKV